MNDPSAQTQTPRHEPRHASTAIVLREHHGEAQVLMTRRHASLTFMGGMWVFPGGALAEADQTDAARTLLTNADASPHTLLDLTGTPLPKPVCQGLAIAALRETFEETGVLLAHRTDGAACDADQLRRIQEGRASIASNAELFAPALLAEGLRLDIGALIYWAHWITPYGPPRRFDTRFFLAVAPQLHEFLADAYETTECVWMTPDALLAASARGDMTIAQPTRYNLEDLRTSLARNGSLAALLRNEATRRVGAIMPKLTKQDGRTVIVMPWDESYRELPGESVAEGQYYEPALEALASRIERDH